MLRYHVTAINGPWFFVLISRTVSRLGVRVGQIRQNASRPFSAPLIPSAIHVHLCLFTPGGRRRNGAGNFCHAYYVYYLTDFPYSCHLGRFSPNDSARRIHKRAQNDRRSCGSGGHFRDSVRANCEVHDAGPFIAAQVGDRDPVGPAIHRRAKLGGGAAVLVRYLRSLWFF